MDLCVIVLCILVGALICTFDGGDDDDLFGPWKK